MDNLPAEINRAIATARGSDGMPLLSSLSNVAKTSHKMHSKWNPILYETVHLKKAKQLRPFLRTIISQPKLAALVSSVRCDWDHYIDPDFDDFDGGYRPRRPPLKKEMKELYDIGLKLIIPKWEQKLSKIIKKGSADAEGAFILLLLPKLKHLHIIFGLESRDEDFEPSPDGFGIERMPLVSELVKEMRVQGQPKALIGLESLEIASAYVWPYLNEGWEYPRCQFWNLKDVRACLFSFPRLRSLVLDQCCGPLGSKENPQAEGKRALEELKIVHSILSVDDLAKIFKTSKTFKKLTYHVALPEGLWRKNAMKKRYTNLAPVVEALKRHQSSLEFLDLLSIARDSTWNVESSSDDFWGEAFPVKYTAEELKGEDLKVVEVDDLFAEKIPQCGEKRAMDIKTDLVSPFDLHKFVALKEVRVQATDVLGAMIRDSPTPTIELHTVLPPSLEILELVYVNYFEERGPQLQTSWQPPSADWYQTYFSHLIAFFKTKYMIFPKLRMVTLRIESGWPEVPVEVLKAAEACGVYLCVEEYVEDHLDDVEIID